MGKEIELEERGYLEKVSAAKAMLLKTTDGNNSLELARANDPSHMVSRISPTPLLMTVAENDVLAPPDIALETYARALEPKQLHIIPGGHFDGYSGPNFELNASTQAKFLKQHLCAERHSMND